MDIAAVVSFLLILVWAALRYGAVLASDWSVCALAIGILTACYFAVPRARSKIPAPSPWLAAPAAFLVALVAFQITPIPLQLLRTLSPVRAQVVEAVGSVLGSAPYAALSVAPAKTLILLTRLLACLSIVFLARAICRRCGEKLWLLALPLIFVAFLEAVLGMLQYSFDRETGARGTYVNRNHFAGLMEMALPFAVMFGFRKLRDAREMFETKAGPAVAACVAFAIAAVIFMAAVFSLSRMGFIACLVGLFLCGAMSLVRGNSSRGWVSAFGLGLLIVVGAFSISTGQLTSRFAEMSADASVFERRTNRNLARLGADGSPLSSQRFRARHV